MVKRYEQGSIGMRPDKQGGWVKHTDYEKLQAENAALKAELAKYENKSRVAMGLEIEKLHRELAEAQKNAERYRWLRDSDIADIRIIGIGKRTGNGLDEAIDKEMAK